MNKSMKILLVAVLVLILGIGVLVWGFFRVYGEAKTGGGLGEQRRIEDFVVDKWHFDRADIKDSVLTAVREMDLTLREAELVGATVFTGDLAPESYLSQAATLHADVIATFGLTELRTVIRYESSDGEEIFSVDSEGKILTCWEAEN